MSLFGTSPEAADAQDAQTRSIFGADVTPANTSTASSLFADEGANNSSPWSMPTPKKNARQNVVKTLLPANDVPDSYIDAFDTIISSDRSGGVSLNTVKSVLSSSGTNAAAQEKIYGLVVPAGSELPPTGLSRNEFNVLMALIGLDKEGEELTLDSVDERRKNLPQPRLEYIDKLRSQAQHNRSSEVEPPSTPSTIRGAAKPRQNSFGGDLSADPWASTPQHTRQTGQLANEAQAQDDYSRPAINGTVRTTSAFSTSGEQRTTTTSSTTMTSGGSTQAGDWSGYNSSGNSGFPGQSALGGGGGSGGFDGDDDSNQPKRPNHASQPSTTSTVVVPPGTGEYVVVNMLPDKEGVFLFQHRNYEVKAIRRGTSVVRRYSDFVWLLDCLQKRYPFRRLPLLPPKRVQVNGNHISADTSSFLEKRRKGLIRFSNQLVQHPILSQETLVVMFLTVPTELSVWRKQATISVQEEFTGKALPADLEDGLPSNLSELFEQVRAGVRRSSEIYINLCVLLERLARRNEGLAADNLRFSVSLETLTESTRDLYAIDTNDVPLLDEGVKATAKHMSQCQTLLEDEARSWDGGVLEDLKSLRDAMVSMRDVFERRDRLARNNIPQLERRIEASENKLHSLRNKASGAVKPGEIEKVESSIMSDKESIVAQHARGVFIKECVRDEIVTFQSTIYATSRLHQDWSQERVKYAELQASNWKGLVDQLESMPVGET